MKITSILVGVMLAGTAAPAFAGSVNELMTRPTTPSILYVGFDKLDAKGNPVCTACQAEQAAKKARNEQHWARRGLPTVMHPGTQTADATNQVAEPTVTAEADTSVQAKQQSSSAATSAPTASGNQAGMQSGGMRGVLR